MHFLLQPIDNQRFLKIIAINGSMDAVLPCVGFERWDLGSIADHALFLPFLSVGFAVPG